MLKKLTPNLMVEDVRQTLAFYQDILGFEVVMTLPEKAPFAFAIVRRGGVELMFQSRQSLSENVPALTGSPKGGSSMNTQPSNLAPDKRLTTSARVLGPRDGEIMGAPTAVRDRFMISGKESGGGFALVEHLMPPKALAAPLHRHSKEDEYSYVLEGRVGTLLGDEEVYGEVGDLIFKPRGQWHTFWNAGDTAARILEIISPGGFEECFLEMHALGDDLNPTTMAEIAVRYGVEVDFERTMPILERHGLTF
jgi:quercetin dioxygenase-like cupin family protein